MPALTPAALDHLSGVDGVDHRAVVAVVPEGSGEAGVGVARYVRVGGDAAEVAVTVIDAYQGRGLGGRLLDALIAEALEHGVTRFEGVVLADNVPMLALLRRAGARFSVEEQGVVRFEMDLRPRAGGPAGSGLER